MDISRVVLVTFLLFVCSDVATSRSIEGLAQPGESLVDLLNLLLEVRGENRCKAGFSFNKLTEKCEKNKDLNFLYNGNGCCNNGTPGR